MSTAVVLTHTQPEQVTEALGTAVDAAKRAGWTLVADRDELAKHGAGADGIEERGDRAPDLCLVLGGDGTILKALRAYAGTEVPVFGFNYGTIGFLAAVEREELTAGLEAAFGGEFEVMRLPALEARFGAASELALNDVSLIRRQHSRVAELAYRLGGKEVGHVRCDGLVAATPGRLDGLQPRQLGPDPGLGGGGLRGQLHLAAHADRATAGRGARRRAQRPQRGRPRPGRRRARR